MKREWYLCVILAFALRAVALAAALVAVKIWVVDESSRPLQGAAIALTAGSQTCTATTDAAGKAP